MSLNLEVQILGEFKGLTKATKGATKQLEGLRKSTQRISRGITAALATIGVGLSFRALTNQITSLTKAAVEDTKAQVILANQLRNAVGANDALIASVEETISQFQIQTGVVDDELRPAYSKIIRSTRDVAQANRVLKIAIDVAAGSGRSLDQVTTAITRGLNGNRASLVRLLPNLKTSADFLGDLEKQFAGAAEAANRLDPYNRLKVSFDEIRETIGAAFLPALNSIADWVDNNLPKIDALADAINLRVKAAFDNASGSAENFGVRVITAIENLTAFLSGTATADNPFSKFFEDLKPFGAVIAGISEIARGLLEIIKGIADGLFGWLSIFTGTGDGLENLGIILQGFGKFLQEVGYWIGQVISFLIPFTGGFKILGGVLSGVSKAGKAVVDFFKGAGDNIAKFFGKSANNVDKFNKAADAAAKSPAISKGLKQIDETLRLDDAAEAAAKNLRFYDNAVNKVKKNFDGWTPSLKRADKALGIIRTGIGTLPSSKDITINIKTKINAADAGEKNRFNNILRDITETGETEPPPGGTGETLFQKRLKAIVATLQDALKDARERIQKASESFRDAVGLSFGLITNGFRARFSISRVIAQMKRIKDAAKTFAADIAELRKKGADSSLIDELIGLGPLGGATTARALLQSGDLGEFLQLRRDLAAQGAGVGGAANFGIYGTSTSGLESAISALNKTIAAGKGNTYNIQIANPNVTPQQIIAAIKDYERKTKKKVLR